MKLIQRDVPPRSVWLLEQAGVHPLLARLYAARGVVSADELDPDLAKLLPLKDLKGVQQAAELLLRAIQNQLRICVVADYDCDGATACAVAIRGLAMLGAQHVGFVVPDRVVDGYGLTPGIAQRVKDQGADVLITVDNGIASVEGVAKARELGLQVLVTDHHLPGDVLPNPDAMVNPNQPGCEFPSKHLAGVGVVFYVLLALRALMREQGLFDMQGAAAQPRLDQLLPLVALGTVADVVRLDANNRRLVAQGLRRIRKGAMPAGMAALLVVAGRRCEQASAQDFGFALGPRINAAGRLADMTLGIACLCTDSMERATELAQALDKINRERRDIEGDMRDQALLLAESMLDGMDQPPSALVLFDPDFHEGVVGIVASRLKDQWHRPTFVFAPSHAPGKENELKGSGRSVAGFHLRDALDALSKRHPHVLLRFGGHAMAAGCTIDADQIDLFESAMQDIAKHGLDAASLTQQLPTDGALAAPYRRVELVDQLQSEVWGQGFAAPVFCETLQVVNQRLVGEKHMSLRLRHQGELVDGIWFGRNQPLPGKAVLAYRIETDEWQGQKRLRFVVQAMQE